MNIAIILSGGNGLRFSKEIPKQFVDINGVPLLAYSLRTFANHPDIDEIYLVTSAENLEETSSIIDKYQINKIKGFIIGGNTRQESSYNAIKYLVERDYKSDDIVLIHDCARPLVSSDIITKNIINAKFSGAIATAIPLTDSIALVDGDSIKSQVKRTNAFALQTPQTFKLGLINSAHQYAKENGFEVTDDSGLMLLIDQPVQIVIGSKKNIKVTTIDDLEIIKNYLKKEAC